MSDLPRGLPPLDPAGLEAARSRTVARGERLRRRRQLTQVGALVATAVVVVGGALALTTGDGGEDRIDVVDDRTTTTDGDGGLEPGSTTTSVVVEVPGGEVTTTTAPAPPPDGDTPPPADAGDGDEARPACTTAVSTGDDDGVPADWQAYWQTEPEANDPMTLELCVSDAFPGPGDGFRLDVTADDPDAVLDSPGSRGFCHLRPCEGQADFGMPGAQLGGEPLAYEVPASPVETPAEERGHATWYADWSYASAGTYTITVRWFSNGYTQTEDAAGGIIWLPTPYRSVAEASLTITVG